jgi:hypothetical protein
MSRPSIVLVVALLAMGCHGGPADDTTDTRFGACGEITTWDVTVIGKVEDAAGNVAGAAVSLEDRGWEPITILGEATTTTNGSFTLEAQNVTAVEGCWGTLLDYVLVATEGSRSGERGINHPLYGAISDGSMEADITGNPLVIE